MSLTNTYENTVLDWLLTTDTATRPTSWYVGLFTSDPTETFSITDNAATNSAAIEFPEATGSWGTITHIGVHDASSGGAMIVHAPLTSSKAIASGDVFRINAGDLDITLD